jgi:alkylation response protein AidB-like acyl-CoA dehydrogenase
VVPEPSSDDARAAAALVREVGARAGAKGLAAALGAAGLAGDDAAGLPVVVLVEAAREAGRVSCAVALSVYGSLGPLAVAAVLTGAAEALAECGMAYARTRVVFGRPLASMPVQRAAFASVAASVEAAVALVRRVAVASSSSSGDGLDAAAVLPFALDAAWAAAEAALQVHGGYGYTDEYPVSRMWREVVAARAAYAGSA